MTGLNPAPMETRAWGTALFAAALALYANISAYPHSFAPLYSVYGDTSSAYWIQSFLDPRLFPHDALAALIKSHMTAFTIERAWLWPTGIFMRIHPYTVGLKVLSVILFTSSALMIKRLARVSGAGSISAAVVALFAVLFLSMDTFYGIPRIYGIVVMLGFITALQQKRFLLLAPIIAAAFLFYPSISVCLGATAAAAPLFYREDFDKKRLALYAAALLAAALFILAARPHSLFMSELGTNMGRLEASKFSQFFAAPSDPNSPLDIFLNFVLNINEHGRFYALMLTLLAAIAAAGFLKLFGRMEFLPKAFAPLLAGSMAAFAILYGVNPASASRQFVFVIPLLLVFLAAEGLERLTGARYRFPALAAIITLFVCANPFLTELQNCGRYRSVYDYLSATAPGTVIAAYPDGMLAATIPIFPRRESFLSYQHDDLQILTHGPDGYEKRAADLLAALYLGKGRMEKFSEDYGVDYLVMEREYYDRSFLEWVKTSALPNSLRLQKVLKEASGDPNAIYTKAGEMADFSWKAGGKEGLVINLHKLQGPAPANNKKAAGL